VEAEKDYSFLSSLLTHECAFSRLLFFKKKQNPKVLRGGEKRDSLSSTTHKNTTKLYLSLKHKILSPIHKAQNATILFSLVRFINKQREEKERSI